MKVNLAKLVTKEAVLKALQKFETENTILEPSTKFDLEYNGNFYPPKEVVREAARILNIKIDNNLVTLYGGELTNKPLQNLGFTIVSKKAIHFEHLIAKYIEILKTKGEPNEKYKYLAIDTFQKNWNLEAIDFFEMFKKSYSKVSNLLYQNSWGFIIKCAEFFPDETKQLFIKLYDEDNLIETRISDFQQQSEILLKSLKIKMDRKNISAQQDERTISVYLSFKYPEKYILYKYDYYQNYCKKADVTLQKTGDRFTHLNVLATTWIKHKYIENIELVNEYRKYYPKPIWDDTRLIIQNILYVCYRFGKNDADLLKTLQQFDYLDLVNYYQFLDKIIQEFSLEENDKRIVFNQIDKQIIFTVGHRHAWNLKNLKSKEQKFRAISTDLFSKIGEKYDGLPMAYLNKEDSFNIIEANSKNIFQAIENELTRTTTSGYYKHNDPNFEKLAFDKEFREELFSLLDKTQISIISESTISIMKNFPLNQILYGAPGTGKTYTTKKLAVEIIDNQEYDDNDRELILERFDELIKSNQILFTTFHQSISYEDFIEGIKPETVDNNVTYEIKDGIFKKIAQLASKEISKKINKKEFESKILLFDDGWNSLIYQTQMGLDNDIVFTIKTLTNKELVVKAVTNQGNLIIQPKIANALEYIVSYNRTKKLFETFNDLKAIKNIDKDFRTVIGGSNSTAYWSVLNAINIFLNENSNLNEPSIIELPKKYVIIIDEINRGNISSIFGELITLIEDDKRKGILNNTQEQIEVELPYSQDKFSVPDNLYIIGTMNTADRSVESLDTALRRRFSFIAMPSKPEKLIDVVLENAFDIDLVKLLETINQRIELLIDKDHQIGHSFFINLKSFDGLKSVFKDKIIPLLEEYFFGDFGKIGLVLGAEFIKPKANKAKFATNFKYQDESDESSFSEKIIYEFTPFLDWNSKTFTSIYE